MSDLESIPQPLEIRLRRTEGCAELSDSICEFENSVFGPDFAYSASSLRSWYDSGSMFSAAICGTAVAGRYRILGLVSALLTDEASRDRLLQGEITDSDLKPWAHCEGASKPSIYFASVISDNSRQLSSMYESVGEELTDYLNRLGLTPSSAFSVASGDPGLRHMERNGFRTYVQAKYLGRYALMTLDLASAKTGFWKKVLSPLEARLAMRGHAPHQLATASRSELVAENPVEDAHEVERRLAQSKTERYRKGLSY